MFYNKLTLLRKTYLRLKTFYFSYVVSTPKVYYYKDREINYLVQNLLGFIHNCFSATWYLIFLYLITLDTKILYLILFLIVFSSLFWTDFLPSKIVEISLASSIFFISEGAEIFNKIFYTALIFLFVIGSYFSINPFFFYVFCFF